MLAPFEDETGISVNYSGKGSNMDTAIDAAVAGGAPPQVALVPSPSTLLALAAKHEIQPLNSVIGSEASDYGADMEQPRHLPGKALWRLVQRGQQEHHLVQPGGIRSGRYKDPSQDLGAAGDRRHHPQGRRPSPFSLCTDIGWAVVTSGRTILKTAGAASYNTLAAHNISWTSPTVTTAFSTMAKLVGNPSDLLGGTKGALSETYPLCADKVFPKPGTMPRPPW